MTSSETVLAWGGVNADRLIFLRLDRVLLATTLVLPLQLGLQAKEVATPPPTLRGLTLDFVQSPYKPDFDKDILIPLHQAQLHEAQKLRAQTAAQEALEATRRAEAARQVQLAAEALKARQQAYTAPQAPQGSCMDWMRAAGVTDLVSAYKLIMMESGCNPNSINRSSGACGVGQQLPCGKWPHTWNDPVGAMIDMQAYVFARYGSWLNALNWEYSNHWY